MLLQHVHYVYVYVYCKAGRFYTSRERMTHSDRIQQLEYYKCWKQNQSAIYLLGRRSRSVQKRIKAEEEKKCCLVHDETEETS